MKQEPIEYSEFLPIWKDYLQGSDGVFNMQMVAHHFYNLGRDTAPRELSYDLIEAIALNYVGDDDELDIIGFARAILKKASEK